MSSKKKQVRKDFRDSVFRRDRYRCKLCGLQSSAEKAEEELDAHHITNRNEFPNGGYVKENGISLCKADCHRKAEEEEVSADELYRMVGSSHELAMRADRRLA